MKPYIRTVATAIAAGFAISELLHYIASRCIGKPYAAAGSIAIIGLVIVLICSIYDFVYHQFAEREYRRVYSRGYAAGTKMNKYKIIIPEETDGRH